MEEGKKKKKAQQKSISTALLGHRDKQSQFPIALALLGVCCGSRNTAFWSLKAEEGCELAGINRTRTASSGEKEGIQSVLESWQGEPEVDE